MKVLVLDDNSRVGRQLVSLLLSKQYRVETLSRAELVVNDAALVAIRRRHVDIVVNCFNLQSTELEDGLTDRDVALANSVAERCQQEHIPFVQLSSAQVFSVSRSQGYAESDTPSPTSKDGEMLLKAEQAVMKGCDMHLVMRVGWVFSDSGEGLLEDILSSLESGKELIVYTGLEGCPTPASDVARVVVACAEQLQAGAECYGLYHYCSSDVTTSEDFIEAIIATCQQYGRVDNDSVNLKLVEHVECRGLATHSVLNCLRILNHFGVKQRPWRSAMASLLKDRYYSHTE